MVDREASDVAARMRKVRSEAAADRIGHAREHDGNCPRLAGKHADRGCALTEDYVGPQIDQLFCEGPGPIRISGAPAKFDPEIAAFHPPQLGESPPESREPRLRSPIVLRIGHKHADQPHPVRLLRTRDKRPCGGSATKKCDELAPPHGQPPVPTPSNKLRLSQEACVVRHNNDVCFGQTRPSSVICNTSTYPPSPK